MCYLIKINSDIKYLYRAWIYWFLKQHITCNEIEIHKPKEVFEICSGFITDIIDGLQNENDARNGMISKKFVASYKSLKVWKSFLNEMISKEGISSNINYSSYAKKSIKMLYKISSLDIFEYYLQSQSIVSKEDEVLIDQCENIEESKEDNCTSESIVSKVKDKNLQDSSLSIKEEHTSKDKEQVIIIFCLNYIFDGIQ